MAGDQLTASAAVKLIDMGLLAEDPETQYAAAMLLRNNTHRLYVTEVQYEWPDALRSWPTQLPTNVRRLLVVALVTWVNERPASAGDWRLQYVAAAAAHEPDEHLRKVLKAVSQSP